MILALKLRRMFSYKRTKQYLHGTTSELVIKRLIISTTLYNIVRLLSLFKPSLGVKGSLQTNCAYALAIFDDVDMSFPFRISRRETRWSTLY